VDSYPNRLKRLVLFPVPWVASSVWYAVSAFLNETTASKVVLLDGPAARTDPIPAGLDEYLDESGRERCEAARAARMGGAPGDVRAAIAQSVAAGTAYVDEPVVVEPATGAQPVQAPPAETTEAAGAQPVQAPPAETTDADKHVVVEAAGAQPVHAQTAAEKADSTDYGLAELELA
jgi:hypothetical protein